MAYRIEIVVEVNVGSAHVSAEQRRVCREDGRYVYVFCSTGDQADPGQPLVEVCNDGRFTIDVLAELHRRTCHVVVARLQNINGNIKANSYLTMYSSQACAQMRAGAFKCKCKRPIKCDSLSLSQ